MCPCAHMVTANTETLIQAAAGADHCLGHPPGWPVPGGSRAQGQGEQLLVCLLLHQQADARLVSAAQDYLEQFTRKMQNVAGQQ